MDPHYVFKRRLLLVGAGFAAVLVVAYIGNRGLGVQYSKSHAAVQYNTVLAQIAAATSTDAIYGLAQSAGLVVNSSTAQDGAEYDHIISINITDPKTGVVLATAQEYDDLLVEPTSTQAASIPPAPYGIEGYSTKYNTEILNWSEWPAGGVVGYDIYRNGALLGTSPQPMFTDNTATNKTNYIYSIKAYDAYGDASPVVTSTQYVEFSSPPLSHASVQGVEATASGNSIKVTWNAMDLSGIPKTQEPGLMYDVYRTTSLPCSSNGIFVGDRSWGDLGSASLGTNITDYGIGYSFDGGGSASGGIDTPQLAPGTYYYCVYASWSDGPASAAAAATVTHPVFPVPNLHILHTTSSSITLSLSEWPGVPVAGYKISRGIYDSLQNKIIAPVSIANISQSASATSTTFTDTGVNVATLQGYYYGYFATAYDASGNSSLTSSEPVVSQLVFSPSQVQGLTATVSGNSTMITWEEVNGSNRYDVFRDTSPGMCIKDVTTSIFNFNFLQVGSFQSPGYIGNAQDHFLDDVPPGTYYYCVVPEVDGGNIIPNYGPVSAEVEAKVTPSTGIPPLAPTHLKIGATTASSVTLSWSSAQDKYGTVAGYNVYRDGVQVSKTTGTAFTDTGLTSYVGHEYSVAAYDTKGNISLQSWSMGAIAAPLPGRVPALFSHVTGQAVQLSWSAAAASGATNTIAEYLLYRATSSPCTFQSTLVGETSTLAWNDTGLSLGNYYYCVAAQDAFGIIGPLSAQTNATVAPSLPSRFGGGIATTTPTTTLSLSVSPVAVTLGSSFAVIWSSENASSCNASGAWSGTQALSGTLTQKPTSTGTNTYTLICKGTLNTASATVTETILPLTYPSVPVNLQVTSSTSDSITFSWSPSTESNGTIVGYKIYRNNVAIATSTVTSFSDTLPYVNATYLYTVASYDAKGIFSAQSAVLTAHTYATTPLSRSSMVNKRSFLSQWLVPNVACAQTKGLSTVVGNNTGQFAECSIAGTNGAASIFVSQNGDLGSVTRNYNFSIDTQDGPADTQFDNAAIAADNEIQALGAPSVTANIGENDLIQVVFNNDPISNNLAYQAGENGIALAISTTLPDGTYQTVCTANLFITNIFNSAPVGVNWPIYIENLSAHEMGHCLGLSHTADPNNVMYGNFIGDTQGVNTLMTFNPAQIKYFQDLKAGNTIQVDPDSCQQLCKEGKGYVTTVGPVSCVSAKTLCGDKPGTIWWPATQSCLSCPAGAYADQTTNTCVPIGECDASNPSYDLETNSCGNSGDSIPDEQCGNDTEGVNVCTYSNGTACTCQSNGFARCTDPNGNPVQTPNGACEGNCQTGQIELGNGQCVANCDIDPTNPSCNACADGLTQLPDGSCVSPACADNPNDPSCPDACSIDPSAPNCPDECTIDPSAPSCPGYCDANPDDSSCNSGYCEDNPSDPVCNG